jgi:hypothetical protein
VSDEIPHRSEHGLVAVGLRDERELAREWERMSRRLADIPRVGAAAGFLIQAMVHGGIEVFTGVNTDPDWGPVLAFGGGGVLVEALGDVSLRPLPLRDGDAEAMIAEARVGALHGGYRGRPPGDSMALAHCLSALAEFAWAERDTISPSMSTPSSCANAVAGVWWLTRFSSPQRAGDLTSVVAAPDQREGFTAQRQVARSSRGAA